MITVEGWHEYSDGADGLKEIDGLAFIKHCREWAHAVLARAGVEERPRTAAEFDALRVRFPDDTVEALAISLGIGSCSLEAAVVALRYARLPEGVINEVLSHAADLGRRYEQITAVARGMTAAATTGRGVLEGQKNAGPGRRLQAEQELLDRWGNIALRIARPLRASDPSMSKAELARQIRAAWAEETSRPSDGNLPKNDGPIVDFLSKHGF